MPITTVNDYSTFVEVEDRDIRCHNQAVVLVNMVEDGIDATGKPARLAVGYALHYWEQVLDEDREQVHAVMKEEMQIRGMIA